MHITELARITGASVDELRYMERKGFIGPDRVRLGRRRVRDYGQEDVTRAGLVLKYRRQGFTWDAAGARASGEIQNPTLL